VACQCGGLGCLLCRWMNATLLVGRTWQLNNLVLCIQALEVRC
jgi:hypothetical protein